MRYIALALALIAVPAIGVAGEQATSLRYVFRTGEVWREEAKLTIEMLDASGTVLSTRESSWVDRVSVASVSTQGSALLHRRSADDGTESDRVAVTISDQGAYSLARNSEAPSRGMLESAIDVRAPALPAGPIARGGTRTRTLSMQWGGSRIDVAETARLTALEETDGRVIATVGLERSARPATDALSVEGLVSSPRGSLIASTNHNTINIDVSGMSGTGELRFDVSAGRPVSYRMEETIGLSVRFGAIALQRTSRITFSLRRLSGRGN